MYATNQGRLIAQLVEAGIEPDLIPSHSMFGRDGSLVRVLSLDIETSPNIAYTGRPLCSDESVHHKNGVRDDNRIDNLELWSRWQPSGQRVEDKITWAKELLALYEPDSLA